MTLCPGGMGFYAPQAQGQMSRKGTLRPRAGIPYAPNLPFNSDIYRFAALRVIIRDQGVSKD